MLSSKETPGTRHAGGWIALGGCLLTATFLSSSGAWHRADSVVVFPRFQIDVNRAQAAELSAVPGVGPKLAQRIIDYRTEHGPFTSLRELENVSGVGPRMASLLGQSMQTPMHDAGHNVEDDAGNTTGRENDAGQLELAASDNQ